MTKIDPSYNDPSQYGVQSSYYGNGKYPPDWEQRRVKTLKRDNWQCQRCGRKSGPHKGDSGMELHVHHSTPISDGGSNILNNLTTLCKQCHDEIHNRSREPVYSERHNKNSLGDGLNAILSKYYDFIIWIVSTTVIFSLYPSLIALILLPISFVSGISTGMRYWNEVLAVYIALFIFAIIFPISSVSDASFIEFLIGLVVVLGTFLSPLVGCLIIIKNKSSLWNT